MKMTDRPKPSELARLVESPKEPPPSRESHASVGIADQVPTEIGTNKIESLLTTDSVRNEEAIQQMTRRSQQGSVSKVEIQNGKLITHLEYTDGSRGNFTSGGGETQWQFQEGR